MVGTSGSRGDRLRLVAASGRNLPLAICWVAAPVLVIMNCTLPASSAVSAGASPANGTWTAMFCAKPGAMKQRHGREMMRRAIAAGGIVELTGSLPHHCNQLRDAVRWQLLPHQQHQGGVGHQYDRSEVLDRVVAQVALEGGHRAVGAGGGHDQRVAVGRSLLCRHHADRAGGAGAVVDHDRPTLLRADPLRDEPRDAVIRPARRIGHDDTDRLARILLGAGARGEYVQAAQQCRRGEELDCGTAVDAHGCSRH